MIRLFKKLYPEKLRTRIMLLAVFLVCISTVTIAYLVEKEGFELLIQEKQQKLLTIAHMLDIELGDTFNSVSKDLPRDKTIQQLNQYLAPKVEQILQFTPQIGAGYYNKELNAIIVYAPEKYYQNKMGITIEDGHPGRAVMFSGQPLTWTGFQVRGNVMNVMIPIIRNGKVLGYIWANELVKDINAQVFTLDQRILFVCLIGLLCSIFISFVLSNRFNKDIDIIKEGLNNLPYNLTTKLSPLKGEMNEIVEGVNHLAEALNEAKSINEMILDSTIDGVITVDINGSITMLNPAAEKILGYSYQDAIGKPFDWIIDDKNYQSPLLDTLHNGNNHIGIEVDFPVSGKLVHLSSSTSHLKNPAGEIIGAVLIFKDLSEQQEIQRVIQKTERLVAIGQLMAGVAHEIRNPLTAIRGFVQYLQKQDTPNDKKQEYINIILYEVDSINKIIQQLLDLSKTHQNYFSSTSLNQVIQDTLVLINSSKYTSIIEFKLNLDESLPSIYLDKAMIKQMLLNLIINSIQAIPNQGTITISTYLTHNKRMQCIEITDTGVGLTKEIQQNLFTPFVTTKPTGTGLGLFVVEKIVTSHHGTIQISNRDEGGTITVINLPIS